MEEPGLDINMPKTHGVSDVICSSGQYTLWPSNHCVRVMLTQSLQHLCSGSTYAMMCKSTLDVSISPGPAVGVRFAGYTDMFQQLLSRQVVTIRVIHLLKPCPHSIY